MHLYIFLSTIFFTIFIFIAFLIKHKPKKDEYYPNNDKFYPYNLRPFLSENEFKFYKALEPIANRYNYIIMAKVRLADLVEVKKGFNNSEYYSYFGKIKSKHVDFVFCDNITIDPVLIIEVDDKSHNRPDRIKRDQFIDNLFNEVNLTILHVNSIHNLEHQITKALQPFGEIIQDQSI